jgi:hypothetical protein
MGVTQTRPEPVLDRPRPSGVASRVSPRVGPAFAAANQDAMEFVKKHTGKDTGEEMQRCVACCRQGLGG